MPAIKMEKRPVVRDNILACNEPGDLNYLFTVVILQTFIEKPSYSTIHNLRKAFVTEPKTNLMIQDIRCALAGSFSTGDIYTAAALAFEEFYARVGRKYEDKKYSLNGDLDEYTQALKIVEELQ